jgi:hypothetical protein
MLFTIPLVAGDSATAKSLYGVLADTIPTFWPTPPARAPRRAA